MNTNVQKRNTAINLRKKGWSYSEIMKEIDVAKGTLSGWLKDISLTSQQILDLNNRLTTKVARGRLQASIALRARRMVRERDVFIKAEKDFVDLIKDPFFNIGLCLYWAEGAKKNGYFAFMNSDPEMHIIMLKWIKKYLNLKKSALKYRLFIHEPYKEENCEDFWAQKLGISRGDLQKTIYKPTLHKVKKNPDYKGCLRLSVTKIDTLRTMMAWQKLLIKYYR
jgi:transcriptional regulator with XRE-family HTH domain